MASFEKALAVVLAHEGGYSDHAADSGGPTKFGVSLRWLQREGHDLDGDGDVDGADIRALTLEEASALYRSAWWDRYGLARITDTQVAAKVFDLFVNTGARRATRLLQQALAECGEAVAVDGNLGPKTIAAANRCEARELLIAICAQQLAFYDFLCDANPKLRTFKRGWSARAMWPWGKDEYLGGVA